MFKHAAASIWQWITHHKIALIAIGFWGVVLLAGRAYMQANDLTFGDLANQLGTMLTKTWYGPLLYMGIYLLRPLLLFPASLLTLLGGSIFGLWPGFLYVWIAGTLSAAFPYALGRWFSDGNTEAQHSQQPADKLSLIQRFTGTLREHPFQAVLTLRLLYLPYDAVSLVAGSLKIPFVIFFIATLMGNLPGTFAYVGIGASLEGDITQGQIRLNPAILAFSVVMLIFSFVISRVLSQRQKLRGGDTPQTSTTTENAV